MPKGPCGGPSPSETFDRKENGKGYKKEWPRCLPVSLF